MSAPSELVNPTDSFARRHLGDDLAGTSAMLAELNYPSVDALVDAAVPTHIRRGPLNLPAASGFIKPDLLNGRPVQGWCAARGQS